MTQRVETDMSDQNVANPAAGSPAPDSGQGQTRKKSKGKKRDRIRAAWISFASRIIAQFIGAAASVALGLLVVHNYTSRLANEIENPAEASARRTAQPPAPTAAAAPAGTIALAVLPLQDFSNGRNAAALAEALTEEIITDLASLEGVRVISRTSSMRYKETDKTLRQIGAELGADVIIEGSVVQAGGSVRVTAQLIDVSTDAHLWARSYDRALGDTLGLQADVAAAIARDVGARLNPVVEKARAIPSVVKAAAASDVLKGSSPDTELR
jgi:TolB-like protein